MLKFQANSRLFLDQRYLSRQPLYLSHPPMEWNGKRATTEKHLIPSISTKESTMEVAATRRRLHF